jgi:hypothetical protein
MQGHYDVKLQADNHVRWNVAARLNRKQTKHIKEKNLDGIQIHS